MPPILSKTFNIPSTGGGTFVFLHRYAPSTTDESLHWAVECGAYIDGSNNVTVISGHGAFRITVSRENGVATVTVTKTSGDEFINSSYRCCFIPGNPFVGPVEPA